MTMSPEPEKNLDRAVARVREARRAGADVVCLPELFRSQYFCQREDASLTALQGAVVLFYPTAIGWHPHEKEAFGAGQRDAWRTIQRSHAIANGVYVAAVNRVGHEKPLPDGAGLEFWGTSFLADPFGVVVAEASTDKEEIVVGEVDLARLEDVRRNWPFLRDRRIDAYAGLEKRYID